MNPPRDIALSVAAIGAAKHSSGPSLRTVQDADDVHHVVADRVDRNPRQRRQHEFARAGLVPRSPATRDDELWFSRIARDLLARGIFTSTTDLARKIRLYIDRYCQPR